MPIDGEIHDTLAMLPGGRAPVRASPIAEESQSAALESTSRPAPWSKSEVLDRLGKDEKLLREMCGIFLAESANLLEKLRQAVAGGEAAAIMRAAHSLKGEVSYLSAPAATEAARRLEDMGHQDDISHAAEAFASLERELEHLWRSIREFAGVTS